MSGMGLGLRGLTLGQGATATPTVLVENVTDIDNILTGVTTVVSGTHILIAPGTYDTQSLTSANFATQPSNVTWRAQDSGNKPILNRWVFRSSVTNLTFQNIAWVRSQVAEGSHWSPQSITVEGVFMWISGTPDGITVDSCSFDGGLDAFADGGALTTNNSLSFNAMSNLTFTNNDISRTFTGLYLDGVSGGLVAANDFHGLHADSMVLGNSSGNTEDIVIRNNHSYDYAGDRSWYHSDWMQIQPSNNSYWVRRIEVYGNTNSTGNAPFIAQGGRASTFTYNEYVGDFAIATSESGNETRCTPTAEGTMTVTLPSAAASLGRQYCFRMMNNGTVNFTLDGADTWAGGTPQMTATGDWVTFVSDGSSEWQKLRPGFNRAMLLCTATRTLTAAEAGIILTIDATSGDVDVTLPAGGSDTYTIRRIDGTANTVRILKDAGDTMTIHGGGVTTLSLVQGYSVDVVGTAGAYAITEDKAPNQLFFANAHQQGNYEDIEVHSNILWTTSGVGFKIQQDTAGVRVHNNTILKMLIDDQNADGTIGPFEGNDGSGPYIDIRGADAISQNNFIAGYVTVDQGTVDGVSGGDLALDLGDSSAAQSTYATYLAGSARSDFRPLTRAQCITAALAASSGALDGTYVGAVGTTAANGYYDFDTGAINSSAVLPSPTIASTTPTNNATEIGINIPITITFNHAVTLGTGNIILRDVTLDATVETFNVATGAGDNGGTVAVSGKVLTITPGADFALSTNHSIHIAPTCVSGTIYGTAFAGIDDDTTLNFTTVASGISFASAITDSAVNSADTRYTSLPTTSRDGYTWNGPSEEQAIDTSFSAGMSSATQTALKDSGEFVFVVDVRLSATSSTDVILIRTRGFSGTEYNKTIAFDHGANDWNVTPDAHFTAYGHPDVSALYSLSAGTVYRIWAEWSHDGTDTRVQTIYNDLINDVDFRRMCVFDRDTFDVSDVNMAEEIAAIVP